MHTLVGLHYSPWSEKARWALDHHRIPFSYEEYVPMLGEPALRARLRRPFGRVSVPVLLARDGAAVSRGDSFAIARFAEDVGRGSPLFGAARESEIAAWNERSEAALRAARALVIYRTAEDPSAQIEALPGYIPAALRGAMRPATHLALSFLRRKYGSGSGSTFDNEAVLRDALDALRAGLAGKKAYLLDGFSFADIAMSAVVQAVKPVADEHLPIGPATRDVWTHPELARQYADLVAWRDALYAKHRRSAS